ncbi:MAG: rhomboid family intramembrane serine protease [Pseudomonadota bacterium]
MTQTHPAMRGLQTRAQLLLVPLALMWMAAAAQGLLGIELSHFGIVPRTVIGLRGILCAPFLHANLAHLLANSAPFLILGYLVMLRRVRDFAAVSLAAILVGGAGTWLFGAAGTVHIGASGVVFGYLGFLLARGYVERSVAAVLLSLAVAYVFGSLLWGVLPGASGVSWEGHLFGCIGGMLAARALAGRARR